MAKQGTLRQAHSIRNCGGRDLGRVLLRCQIHNGLYGGGSLEGLALSQMIGAVIGTLSSIFLACPMLTVGAAPLGSFAAIAACDAARRMAVDTLTAERAMQDRLRGRRGS